MIIEISLDTYLELKKKADNYNRLYDEYLTIAKDYHEVLTILKELMESKNY